MLHFKDYRPGDPIFTHVLPDGTNIHIDSVRLRAWCIAMKPQVYHIPVDWDLARSFVWDNIASHERALELAFRPHLDPIIYCKNGKFTDGRPDAFFVDGHHRYVLAYMQRSRFIPGHVLELNQWEHFKIEGVPSTTRERLLAMPITKRNY